MGKKQQQQQQQQQQLSEGKSTCELQHVMRYYRLHWGDPLWPCGSNWKCRVWVYPPGNDHTSHLGNRKIIFKSALKTGYVSSLEGIFPEDWHGTYFPGGGWFRSCSFLFFMGDGSRFQLLIFQGVYSHHLTRRVVQALTRTSFKTWFALGLFATYQIDQIDKWWRPKHPI